MNKCRHIILFALTSFLCVACDKQETDIIPGILYHVTTTKGEGYAQFEQKANNKWNGILYLDEGQLVAMKHTFNLKIGKELTIVDETGKKLPIISYTCYKKPKFKEYPETWSYKDSVYSVSIIENVIYGHASGYWVSYPDTGGTFIEIYNTKKEELKQGKKELDLNMDVYIPNDDKTVLRPLLVLVHGGAFFNGDKTDLGFPTWARYFAGLGYVVASVNYRLGFRKILATVKASVKRAGFRAVQDVDAAIRYIIINKDIYSVDPDRIFVAGTSAGGITALNIAFMKDEDIPLEANNEGGIKSINPSIQESYTIRAVGNLWGAVNDLSILNNTKTSVISFHNTNDPVVPYAIGHPFSQAFLNQIIFPTMYGSGEITEYLGNQRAALFSYTLQEPDKHKHTLHICKDENDNKKLNSIFYEIETGMRDFFSEKMLSSPVNYKHNDFSHTFQVSSSDIDSVYWCVEGGVIQKQMNKSIDVLLFPDAVSYSVTVCGKYKNGLTFRHQWNL